MNGKKSFEKKFGSKLANILDELMTLNVSDLSVIKKCIEDIAKAKVKMCLKVGQKVFVVQKTKKTPGVIKKINQSKAQVHMRGEIYNVPFSMLEAA